MFSQNRFHTRLLVIVIPSICSSNSSSSVTSTSAPQLMIASRSVARSRSQSVTAGKTSGSIGRRLDNSDHKFVAHPVVILALSNSGGDLLSCQTCLKILSPLSTPLNQTKIIPALYADPIWKRMMMANFIVLNVTTDNAVWVLGIDQAIKTPETSKYPR